MNELVEATIRKELHVIQKGMMSMTPLYAEQGYLPASIYAAYYAEMRILQEACLRTGATQEFLNEVEEIVEKILEKTGLPRR